MFYVLKLWILHSLQKRACLSSLDKNKWVQTILRFGSFSCVRDLIDQGNIFFDMSFFILIFFLLKAKGQFKKQSVANGVEISVPVPNDADSPKFKTNIGSAKYLPEKNTVVWNIKSFPVRKIPFVFLWSMSYIFRINSTFQSVRVSPGIFSKLYGSFAEFGVGHYLIGGLLTVSWSLWQIL